jgi:hypothetical protein
VNKAKLTPTDRNNAVERSFLIRALDLDLKKMLPALACPTRTSRNQTGLCKNNFPTDRNNTTDEKQKH